MIHYRPTIRLRCFSSVLRIATAILLFSAASAIATDPVKFEDANLEASVRAALQMENDPLTVADLEQLTELNVMGRKIESLAGLEFAKNMQRLNLRDNRVTDLSPLAPLFRLTALDLRNNRVQDLSPLAGLEQLEVLGLRDNRVVDISPLAEAVLLRELDLRNNRVEDISPVAKLTDLRILGLRDNRVADLSPLAPLFRLTDLDLLNNRVRDLSPLAGLEKLEVLGLRDNHVVDISPLAGTVLLRELDLRNNRVEDISPVAKLTDLRILGLRDNRVADISPLVANVRLQHLDLRNNQRISDISPLAGLQAIEWLSLRDCTVSKIQSLAGLHRLRYIDLHHNRVKDISLLNDLPALQWVDLRRNHLRFTEDAHALATMLLLKRNAERVHYSPQKNFLKPATASAIPKKTEAVAESVVNSASPAESLGLSSLLAETAIASNSIRVDEAAPNRSATTRLPKESVLFAAGVELTLIFNGTAEEFTLRFTGAKNIVEVVRSDLGGEYTYTYAADQPTEAQLLLILGRHEEDGYLYYYELQLSYETPDTGLFEGSVESVTNESSPRSGEFRWH